MRAISFVSFLFAAVSFGSAAQAAGPVITYATINSGTLVVKGTAAANQTVTLDKTHTVTSTASGTFAFSIAGYSPDDCVVLVVVGTGPGRATAGVDNCKRSDGGANITGAISVSAITNARCATITGSVSGAKVGDAVILSTKGPLAGGMLIYGQGVPADNQVSIKVCNLSGATSAAISDLPVHVVTFR
jgi:hypothetical protein